MPVRHHQSDFVSASIRPVAIGVAAVIIGSLFTSPSNASPRVKIDGDSESLTLVVDDASIVEVLSALSTEFHLTYASMVQLDSTIAGTYSGNLQDVLERLLDGYDYVAAVNVDGVELKVWRRSGSIAVAPELPSQPNLAVTAGQVAPRAVAPPVPGPSAHQPPFGSAPPMEAQSSVTSGPSNP